jgi:exodeoxyribonuclease VII large subunit
MSSAWQRACQLRISRQERVTARLAARLPDVAPARATLVRLGSGMVQAQRRLFAMRAASLEHAQAQLRALSPEHTLGRGYAIVQTRDGSIVRDASRVESGQALDLTLAKGVVQVHAD